jgi:hypothetical protein
VAAGRVHLSVVVKAALRAVVRVVVRVVVRAVVSEVAVMLLATVEITRAAVTVATETCQASAAETPIRGLMAVRAYRVRTHAGQKWPPIACGAGERLTGGCRGCPGSGSFRM